MNYQQTWHHLPPSRPNAGPDGQARLAVGVLLVLAALGTATVLMLVI